MFTHPEPQVDRPSYEEIPISFEELPIEIETEHQEHSLERKTLIDITKDVELSDEACLELIITIDERGTNGADEKELNKLLAKFKINTGDISENDRTQLLLLLHGARRTNNEITRQELTTHAEAQLNEALARIALQQIKQFSTLLENQDITVSEAESALRSIMDRLHTIAINIPMNKEENLHIWDKIHKQFKKIIAHKKESRQEISLLMSRILNEYSDFIDDEFIAKEVARNEKRGKLTYVEQLLHDTYGHSKEEIEDIKIHNREEVVTSMHEMTDEPYVTTKMLLSLYRTNNRGIAPKYLSRLRERPEENVRFGGKRLGIMPEDVAEEMKDFESRIADTIDRSIIENWSGARYQIAVAQLHNELIEIHPFPDRNGSTGLLFMELMMMRRGYKPPKKREKNYYKNVSRILKHNPVAMSLIAGEMYNMTHRIGFFPGKTTKGKEKLYEIALKHLAV